MKSVSVSPCTQMFEYLLLPVTNEKKYEKGDLIIKELLRKLYWFKWMSFCIR